MATFLRSSAYGNYRGSGKEEMINLLFPCPVMELFPTIAPEAQTVERIWLRKRPARGVAAVRFDPSVVLDSLEN